MGGAVLPMKDAQTKQSVLLCAVGDCHGAFTLLYRGIAMLEEALGQQVDLVLQVGDFGIWPDPSRIDVAARNHGGAGEFADWLSIGDPVPRRTVFIAGNHEDFDYLDAHNTGEILPQLVYLASGDVLNVNTNGTILRIGGIGGCFGPSDFRKETLAGRRRRHFTQSQLDELVQKADGRLDILLLHDAPAGRIVSMNDTRNPPYQRHSPAEGLVELISQVQPRICLTGHWHFRTERTVAGVRTVGLNMIPHPGSMIVMGFDVESRSLVDRMELGGQFPQLRSPNVIITPPDPTTLELAGILEA